MEVTIIIALVLYALAIIMAIKLIKNVLVAIGTILLISLLLISGTGLFVYTEVVELQETFPVSNNLFLLTEGDTVLSGMVMLPVVEDGPAQNMQFLDNESISSLNAYLSSEDFDSMRDVVRTSDFLDEDIVSENDLMDETYKIVFFELAVIESSPVEEIDLAALAGVDHGGDIFRPIPREDSILMIREDEPWERLANFIGPEAPDLSELEASLEEQGFEIINETEDIDEAVDESRKEIVDGLRRGMLEQFGNDDLGSLMFMLNIFSIFEQEGPEGLMYLYEHYSAENIYIRDESIIFDLLRLSPDALVTAVINEAHNAASAVGGEVADRVSDDIEDAQEEAVDEDDDSEEIPDLDDVADDMEMDTEDIEEIIADEEIDNGEMIEDDE